MKEVLIPAITAAIGFAIANWKDILGWRNKSSREEISLYKELQDAVKSAREDLVSLYKIIDEMEAKNIELKKETIALRQERDSFKALADEARKKVDETLAYVKDLEDKLRGYRMKVN